MHDLSFTIYDKTVTDTKNSISFHFNENVIFVKHNFYGNIHWRPTLYEKIVIFCVAEFAVKILTYLFVTPSILLNSKSKRPQLRFTLQVIRESVLQEQL